MTSVHRDPPPKFPVELGIGITIALAVTGIPSVVQHTLDQQKYESAMQSYQQANCRTATPQFNQIIQAFRLVDMGDYVEKAKEKKAECEFFEDAVESQKAGKYEDALLNYAKVAVYEGSALLKPAQDNLRQLFQKTDSAALATICV
jgi:hypothetical protein